MTDYDEMFAETEGSPAPAPSRPQPQTPKGPTPYQEALIARAQKAFGPRTSGEGRPPIANALQRARAAQCLSAGGMAAILKVSRSLVAQWEAGIKAPKAAQIVAYTAALNLDPIPFLFLAKLPHPQALQALLASPQAQRFLIENPNLSPKHWKALRQALPSILDTNP